MEGNLMGAGTAASRADALAPFVSDDIDVIIGQQCGVSADRNALPTCSVDGPFGVHDTFRQGFRSVAYELAPKHPLQARLSAMASMEENRRLEQSRSTQGLHMPFRLAMEKHILSQTRRLPLLPSSNLGLDILNGADEDLDISDILNVAPMPVLYGGNPSLINM